MSSVKRKIFFEDYFFLVDKNVYEPAEDSFLFAENLPTEKARKAIDVGAGCGILGIIAAETADEVVAIDVNPYAVLCAKQNATLNHAISKMIFIQGDLFGSLKLCLKFDLVLFNAPYLPSENEDDSWQAKSWAGGQNGRSVIDRFIDEVPTYLSPNGQILLMQSSLSNVDKTLMKYKNKGLTAKVVTSKNLPFFEKIVLTCAKWS
jgi:release factor glutamine methyltransferase